MGFRASIELPHVWRRQAKGAVARKRCQASPNLKNTPPGTCPPRQFAPPEKPRTARLVRSAWLCLEKSKCSQGKYGCVFFWRVSCVFYRKSKGKPPLSACSLLLLFFWGGRGGLNNDTTICSQPRGYGVEVSFYLIGAQERE